MNSETPPPQSVSIIKGFQLCTSQFLLRHQPKQYKYHNRLVKNPKVSFDFVSCNTEYTDTPINYSG
jgi:hypothetical protein